MAVYIEFQIYNSLYLCAIGRIFFDSLPYINFCSVSAGGNWVLQISIWDKRVKLGVGAVCQYGWYLAFSR
jgi:hypothetical protein